MNKENAHEYLPLIQAFADGKEIECLCIHTYTWESHKNICFDEVASYYRIKPEPRTFEMWYYRPTGRMYPWVEDEKQYVESDEWERITVQEVLK